MKRYIGLLGLCAPLCIVLLLGGCLSQEGRQDSAAMLAQQMHAAMQTQDWDAAMPLYGDAFLAGHDRQAWRDKLASLQERFGKLQKIKPEFDQRSPRLGGVVYAYGFKLVFERGVVRETLSMFKDDQDNIAVTDQIFKFKDDLL